VDFVAEIGILGHLEVIDGDYIDLRDDLYAGSIVDSRLLITRFVDPDAAKLYGYMVYVRCT
jgi:hypothetical protein